MGTKGERPRPMPDAFGVGAGKLYPTMYLARGLPSPIGLADLARPCSCAGRTRYSIP